MAPNNLTINFRTKKEIPEKTLNEWKLKMYYTSYTQIKKSTGISRVTIAEVFKDGKATQRIIEIFTTTYFAKITLPTV
jgi:hypothetical protein